jgi:hypothetical protein
MTRCVAGASAVVPRAADLLSLQDAVASERSLSPDPAPTLPLLVVRVHHARACGKDR